MSARELEAAGISSPALRESYEACRKLNAEHGKTYYLATLLLPPAKRPYVHALYGFARYADEIVDDLASTLTDQEKADWLGSWGDEFLRDLGRGYSEDPICRAVVDTALRWEIPATYFESFLHSMRMDLTVTRYETFDDLMTYIYGSASVIGLQMVHVLETQNPADLPEALDRAEDLGVAFQLANFIRDVGEDLDRGRIYLPLDELARFGVTPESLEQRVVTPALVEALRFQITRVRALEQRSRSGIPLLLPASQPCIEAARVLYCGIVDAVESIDYQVFDQRATVPMSRRLAVAGPTWARAVRNRRKFGSGSATGVAAAV